MFYNNIVKISEKDEQTELVENMPLCYTNLHISAQFAFILLWEKVRIIDRKTRPPTRICSVCH